MDLDHLLLLVTAARDEGDATNDTGPAYDALVVYLDKESPAIAWQARALRSKAHPLWSGCPFCSQPVGKPHADSCRHPGKPTVVVR